MKFVLVLVVVLVVLWLVRRAQGRVTQREEAAPPTLPRDEMVACLHCGLHLPRGDALPGRGGVFCSEAHRTAFEQEAR